MITTLYSIQAIHYIRLLILVYVLSYYIYFGTVLDYIITDSSTSYIILYIVRLYYNLC